MKVQTMNNEERLAVMENAVLTAKEAKNSKETIPPTSKKSEKTVYEKVAHAVEVMSQIAKLQKKYGKPPKWISVSGINRQMRRSQPIKRRNAAIYPCVRCHKPFISPAIQRCQCKVQRPRSVEVA